MGEERKIHLVDWKLVYSLLCDGPWVSEVEFFQICFVRKMVMAV